MLRSLDRPGGDDVARVLALAEAAAQADGVAPLNEDTLLTLRHGGEGQHVHLLTGEGDEGPVGYAHLEVTAAGAAGELVVHPGHRRRGHGRTLVAAALDHTPAEGQLDLWAHGDGDAARVLAAVTGFAEVRRLLRLHRPLDEPLPAAPLPDGVTLRAFRPGADDAAWLAVNARAFAQHPEQGGTTQADLDARMAEPWFDPAGFLLAERDGGLAGFHWTKVHPGTATREPVGEIYVLGIDPGAQGGGLGRALAVAGLEHLRNRGLHRVMLYVEAGNPAAVRLYERLGFTLADADVMYGRTVPPNG